MSSETMLVAGMNDDADSINAVGRFLAEAGIATAYLAVPIRPPAVGGVRGPDEEVVNRAFQSLSERVSVVELLTGYEGDAFASSGDARADLLAITAVHPMRESAVRALLAKTGSPWSLVEELVETGMLRRLESGGERFYLRRLRED